MPEVIILWSKTSHCVRPTCAFQRATVTDINKMTFGQQMLALAKLSPADNISLSFPTPKTGCD